MEGPSPGADNGGQGNQKQAERMTTDLDIAWAAGFFDGEGSISIRFGKMGVSREYGRRTYTLFLRASQVDRAPLDKFVRIFECGNVGGARQSTSRRAPYFDWCTSGKSAGRILRLMLPHLTVKRERADLALQFQARVEMSRAGRSKIGYRLSDEEMALRDSYFVRMKFLNLRQVARAAAETKSENLQRQSTEGCDSPVCIDDKDAERGGNARALKLVV